jgi:hypothetical protein
MIFSCNILTTLMMKCCIAEVWVLQVAGNCLSSMSLPPHHLIGNVASHTPVVIQYLTYALCCFQDTNMKACYSQATDHSDNKLDMCIRLEMLFDMSCTYCKPVWLQGKNTKLHPHRQDQTQYRWPTVKEHDHHWDSQQDLTNWNCLLILRNKF